MIELPEARTIAKDLRETILGKEILAIGGNFVDHKFTFYENDPNEYHNLLAHKKVTKIVDRNFYVEIEVEDYTVILRDGANIRYYEKGVKIPKKSKLLIQFHDGSYLNVIASMYCFIAVFSKDDHDHNEWYEKELSGISPLDEAFTFAYFQSLLNTQTSTLSCKAFLATEQRILGVGNGVLQDILYYAHLSPKRKMDTLNDEELFVLYESLKQTLLNMIKQGGRDVEKNIFNEFGGYQTVLSKKTYQNPCPTCQGNIKKEAFLGGSIYYCPHCQK